MNKIIDFFSYSVYINFIEISDILVDYATDSDIKLDDNFLKKANDLINLLK